MALTIVIPARLAAVRLPEKPLADIGGAPMVVRVAQRVASVWAGRARIVVAADHDRILDVCRDFGVEALRTDTNLTTGTDRVAQAAAMLGLADDDFVVNVQGDEPLIDPTLIDGALQSMNDATQACGEPVLMGTAAHPIGTLADFRSPGVVKVVVDARSLALYFSRAQIAFARDTPDALPNPAPLRHIGIYAFRAGFLRTFSQLPPAPIERTESLEQLRVLWHGYRIAVHRTELTPEPGVDTPEDLERVRRKWAATSTPPCLPST
ncbi:3-deoxy-manno-octulosonate cytidylyltransferase [Candidatus Symbiobacter mobilis]|uniref:3-deoxy-manno-octulosonate cytidylyltransferase n=1 Tax=Candidatus Symbiobacter mobilis CR TaxID=946483 RepID=U5NDY7_9BURK|nr:3-deoxy-manno-octulosonate cytidylyltransferase [Candidatus Symbiobacter mobilis]AGX88334.1 3-deoxy-D-manno-octulosonate cytidylyltransferase [Candidatus Symbiobacter mobilis CR]